MAKLAEYLREATAGVARVVLSGNMITNGDKDLSGLTALCEALPAAKNLTAIDFSSCGIEVKGVNEIAKAVSAGAVLNSLTLHSTGDMENQKTYTLTTGEDNIDLGWKSIGPADCHLLVAWLQQPEVGAVVADLNISEAIIGDAGSQL